MPKSYPSSSLFGRRLREAREKAGIPQDKLGVMIGLDEGCSSARISRYETGVHQPPLDLSERLAGALGVPLAYLYCREDVLAELLLAIGPLPEARQRDLLQTVNSIYVKSGND